MDRDSFVTADRQGTHRSAGQSDSPVTDRHSRASLRSGLTFLVSSGLPRFPDFFVTFRILSLGAASLIQSLPGGYIPRVEKERDRLVAVDNILNYRLLLELESLNLWKPLV